MATVQDCIDGLHVTYPQVQDDQALLYFRQVHREVCNLGQLNYDSYTFSSLVAGTREYVMSDLDVTTSVRAAYYQTDADTYYKLTPTSTDWLDEYRPNWRLDTDTGQPEMFYIEGKGSYVDPEETRIGFYPTPNTTSTSGYPRVVTYGTTYQAMNPTEDIAPIIPSIRVYIEGMKKLYASDRDPDRLAMWDELYKRELHSTLAYINNTIEDLDAPRVVPRWMRNTSVR